jgi:hypothetical protein
MSAKLAAPDHPRPLDLAVADALPSMTDFTSLR